MERLIPDAGLVLFEGAGHFPYLEERGRYNAINFVWNPCCNNSGGTG